MTLVLSHPETLHTELIVGATGARFPEVHALARALRDHRIEPVLRRVREFHDKLMVCEEAHGAAVSSNPQAHDIDTAGLDQQQVQMRVLVEARRMALRSMRSHGSVPHRCAETAAYLELELREHNL